MDYKKLTDKFKQLGEKYKGKHEDNQNSKSYRKLEEGIRLVEEVRVLVNDLNQKVERGNVAVKGALALTRKKLGNQIEGDKKSLDSLRLVYDGERSNIGRLVAKVTRRRTPSLKKSLEMIGEVTEQIPPYVERLSVELGNRIEELTELKGYLRENIEKLLEEKNPLENDIYQLEDLVKSLDSEYETLEQQRLENSSKGIRTDSDLLTQIGMLDIARAEAKDNYSELNSRKQHMQGNVELINNQIGKVNELMNLLSQSHTIVYSAKEFVDIQVPYILNEMRNQGSMIHSLSGIERTMKFLDDQRVVSARINDRIKLAVNYLDGKVDEVRGNAIASQSIYSLPHDNQDKISDPRREMISVEASPSSGNGSSALDRYKQRFSKE